MNSIQPISEEFLYCDPECVHDWISPSQSVEPCYACCLPQAHLGSRSVVARQITAARRIAGKEVPDEQ